MKKIIHQTTVMPKGYGFAYWLPAQGQIVCYPLGINVIVYYSRVFFWWLQNPSNKRF